MTYLGDEIEMDEVGKETGGAGKVMDVFVMERVGGGGVKCAPGAKISRSGSLMEVLARSRVISPVSPPWMLR